LDDMILYSRNLIGQHKFQFEFDLRAWCL